MTEKEESKALAKVADTEIVGADVAVADIEQIAETARADYLSAVMAVEKENHSNKHLFAQPVESGLYTLASIATSQNRLQAKRLAYEAAMERVREARDRARRVDELAATQRTNELQNSVRKSQWAMVIFTIVIAAATIVGVLKPH